MCGVGTSRLVNRGLAFSKQESTVIFVNQWFLTLAKFLHLGYDVLMCSRKKEKAQEIVDSLKSGNGYMKKVEGKNAGQG